MQFELKLKLAMWEAVQLAEKRENKETGKWEKTGEKTERTQYIFRDEFGDKLTVLAGNEYRHLEGVDCIVKLKVSQKEWEGKRTTSLSLLKAEEA